MALKDQQTLRVVLYEGQGAAPLGGGERYALVTTLLEKGHGVSLANGAGELSPPDASPLLVLGHFEESFSHARDANAGTSVQFRNIVGLAPAQAAEAVESLRAETQVPRPGDWKPWFPVIDYNRCTNCMQCLSFCLFGVYGVDAEQKIQVQNNEQCKTNCPACSRVCPEAAIMFPKYKAGPINGDEVSEADLNREKMKVDISALLGGDVYALLRERSEKARSRFSKERDSNKALQERQKCLVKLAQAGDIPAEVLMALPSPEEIQRRAAEAAAKARAALGQT